MESLKRGWSFLKQSWQMVGKDKDLIKPSIYTLVAGFIVTLILVVPVGFVTYLIQGSTFGRIIVYIMWAIVIFIQYTVGYVFSAMTVYLIYGYLAEGDGRMDKAWAIVKRDMWDIASLAAASTAVNLFSSAVRGSKGGIRGMVAKLIETVWTEASYLILPAMVVENINLKDGIKRAAQIIKDNLLLVGISAVGVKAIVGFVSFILGAFGIALGLGIGVGIVSVSQASTAGVITGVTVGILVATPFILFATVISTYTATAYHTCLYLWARDVERARLAGQTGEIAAPTPLAAALQ
jgi:Family of unknown function (DUF6159)